MFAVSSVFFLLLVSFCYGQQVHERQCPPDTIDFATKVEKSSVVVYGKAMAKILSDKSDSTFHIFFQVDCILKGPATLRQINITDAGRIQGKQFCQEFPVGRGYSIAFLEPISLNKTDRKTYVPADFTEILDEGNSTSQLLARTCNLHRLVPLQSLASVADVCPVVGTDPICRQLVNTTIVTIRELNDTMNIILSNDTTFISNNTLLLPNNPDRFSHPIPSAQQEIDAIRSKSGDHEVDIDEGNGANSITFSIFLMIIAMFFCSN